MLARTTTFIAVVAVAFCGGCASKPPPHHWIVAHKSDHIPMQGLPARPRLVTDERPVQLVNFGDEAARIAERNAAIAQGAVTGAALVTLEAGLQLAPLLPLCVLVVPLCVGVVAAGGAVGASQSATAVVPQAQANRLADIVTSSISSETVRERAAPRVQTAPDAPEYPRVVLRLESVILVPARRGVTFRVAASAQAWPKSDQAWQPSIHYTQLPIRELDEWLKSDGAVLRADLDEAVRRLGYHIGPTYLPYTQR